MDVALAILLALFGGAVGGLLGVGGGILFVPALAIFLGNSQLEAEATSLLVIVPMAVVGTWRQVRHGNVDVRDGLLIARRDLLGDTLSPAELVAALYEVAGASSRLRSELVGLAR